MKCNQVQNLLAEFELGFLKGDKAAAVESHLMDCAGCRQVFEQHRKVSLALGRVRMAKPPPGLWQKVADRIAQQPKSVPWWTNILEPLRFRVVRFGLAAGLAFVLLTFAFTQRTSPPTPSIVWVSKPPAREFIIQHVSQPASTPFANQPAHALSAIRLAAAYPHGE